jgi:hypothetical protein
LPAAFISIASISRNDTPLGVATRKGGPGEVMALAQPSASASPVQIQGPASATLSRPAPARTLLRSNGTAKWTPPGPHLFFMLSKKASKSENAVPGPHMCMRVM